MSVHELLDVNCIKIGLEGQDTEEIVAELVELLVKTGKLDDRDAAIECVLDREAKSSTGIGGGLAVPHGKLDSVPKLTVALGIAEDGVEFDSIDHKPVYVVLLMLARADQPGPHILALREASTLMGMPQFFDRLVHCRTPREALDTIRAEEE